MELIVHSAGSIRCLYDEAVNLKAFGPPRITRASHVEPDGQGRWYADLAPVAEGVKLGPFDSRSQALVAERRWLETRWLPRAPAD